MITRHTRGKVEWIDLESPTHEELNSIMSEFGIDSRIEEEIISPTPYPMVITFPEYLYLILHFPTTDPKESTKNQEIDFIVGKNFIITARYEVINSIHNLHKVFEAEELLGVPESGAHADIIIENILRRLYGAIRNELEQVSYVLERIEQKIFSGKEREMVRTISETNRVLLRFETTLSRHSDPLETFLKELSTPVYFGKSFAQHATHILAERDHVATLVSSYRSVATELRLTNDSLLSANQNEVMKTLTVVTFIVFPLSLIAAIFQMNAPGTPILNSPDAFWIIIFFMLIVTGLLTLFVVKKRWL